MGRHDGWEWRGGIGRSAEGDAKPHDIMDNLNVFSDEFLDRRLHWQY